MPHFLYLDYFRILLNKDIFWGRALCTLVWTWTQYYPQMIFYFWSSCLHIPNARSFFICLFVCLVYPLPGNKLYSVVTQLNNNSLRIYSLILKCKTMSLMDCVYLCVQVYMNICVFFVAFHFIFLISFFLFFEIKL